MKRPPLNEVLALFQATVAAEGVTTAPGAAAGNSIIDAGLALSGANSFLSMLMVVYPGQPRLVDSMDITGFINATGEVTLSTAYKGVAAPIPAGVPYKIVTFRFVPAEVAALTALVHDISVSTQRVLAVSVTSAADAGDVTIATVATAPVIIDSVIIHADAAQTGDMTSCGVFGGVGKVVTFIPAAVAIQANLNAADKQVSDGDNGDWRLAVGKTMVISLVGTGATAVDLTVIITYHAETAGGVLG